MTAVTYTPATDTHSGGTVTYDATTLTDSGKTWTVNQWVGAEVEVGGQTVAADSNTATAVTVASWPSGTPANGTAYHLSQQQEPVEVRVGDGILYTFAAGIPQDVPQELVTPVTNALPATGTVTSGAPAEL